MPRPFKQIDVFTTTPYLGNPVAVVLDGAGLTSEEMARVTIWMNLSETTFVVPPSDPTADYQVRIFTPFGEVPFAGHPTLGTCHAWLEHGGTPKRSDVVVQQCQAGLVPIRRSNDGFAFAAPPLVRTGPVEEQVVDHVATVLGIQRSQIADSQWVDNGPGWVAVLLNQVDDVLKVQPGVIDGLYGVVGLYPPGSTAAIEVRGFFPKDGATTEDPVTGSLNASLAEWLLRTKRVMAPYVASQGAALGRAGRVHISTDDDEQIWVGGGTVTCIAGTIEF